MLGKKGILKKFLYQNEEVKLGDEITLIENENGESIITVSMDEIIVKPIKEGAKIKLSTVIAHLLTTEDKNLKSIILNVLKITNLLA